VQNNFHIGWLLSPAKWHILWITVTVYTRYNWQHSDVVNVDASCEFVCLQSQNCSSWFSWHPTAISSPQLRTHSRI